MTLRNLSSGTNMSFIVFTPTIKALLFRSSSYILSAPALSLLLSTLCKILDIVIRRTTFTTERRFRNFDCTKPAVENILSMPTDESDKWKIFVIVANFFGFGAAVTLDTHCLYLTGNTALICALQTIFGNPWGCCPPIDLQKGPGFHNRTKSRVKSAARL